MKAAISLDLGLVFFSRAVNMASALAAFYLNSDSGRLLSEHIVRLHRVGPV